MKTKSKSKILVLMALFLIVISASLQAQCPIIESNLGCQVDETIDIYDYASPPSGPCNTTACNSYPFTIASNGTFNINCGGCSPVCNIIVTITDLNGAPVSPPLPADFSATTAQSITWGTPCTSSGFVNIKYDPSTNRFKIFQ